MTHDETTHENQLSDLMENAMLSVTASEDVVAGGLSRGRRVTRRRRTARAAGIGAAAVLATVAAVATPSLIGGPGDDESSVGNAAGDVSAAAQPTREPTSPAAADTLPPALERAQNLLLDAYPRPVPEPGISARVRFDPDGRGRAEIYLSVTSDNGEIVPGQDARCERVASSPGPDDCVDTGTGWIFTAPSLPDISGNDAEAAGVEAIYIFRDGNIVTLIAYNTADPVGGGAPTRTDPVLDADELVELLTRTEWFD